MAAPPTIGGPPFPGYGFNPYMYGPPPPMVFSPPPPRMPLVQRVEQKTEKIDFQAQWNSNIDHSINCPFCQKKFFFKERVLLEKLKIEEASKKIEREWKTEASQNQFQNQSQVQSQIQNQNYISSNGNYHQPVGNNFNFDANFVREKHTQSEIIEDDGNQNQFGYKLAHMNNIKADAFNPIEVQSGYAQRIDGGDFTDNQSDNSLGQSVTLH